MASMTMEELNSRLQALEQMGKASKAAGKSQLSSKSKSWAGFVDAVFPGAVFLGEGWSKRVWGISDDLVLKVGAEEDVRITMQAYEMISKAGFLDRIAIVLVSSEHCIVQERGEPGEAPEVDVAMTKKLVNQFGVTDARAANFMRFGTAWKLIDFTPVGLNSFKERKRAREDTMDPDPFGIGFVPVGSSKKRRRGTPWSSDLQF